MEEEARLAGLSGSALEATRLQIELETAAKKRGLEVSEAMAASIQKEVEARRAASQAAAVAKLDADISFERDQLGRNDSEARIASRLRPSGLGLDSAQADAMRLNTTLAETKDLLSTAGKGFLADIRAGKSAADAFANVLDQIVTKLANKAIDGLVSGLLSGLGGLGGGGFGLLSLIGLKDGGYISATDFIARGYATGGFVSGPGGPQSDSVYARLSNGEFVMNAAATTRHRPLLESLNTGGLPGFDRGGPVGSSAPIPYQSPTPYAHPTGNSGQGQVGVQIINRTTGNVEGTAKTELQSDGSLSVIVDLVEARIAGKAAGGTSPLNDVFRRDTNTMRG